MKKKRIWPILALLITVLLMISAFGVSSVTVELFWKIGSDPAVAALQGEHLGAMICAVLLTAAPFIPVVCFLLDELEFAGQGGSWSKSSRRSLRHRRNERNFISMSCNRSRGYRMVPLGLSMLPYAQWLFWYLQAECSGRGC